MSKRTAITPTREDDYPEWYQQVVKAAELAENSPVRGCMVIKPWGFAMWENIQRVMNEKFRAQGVENAYFPLFIPVSYLSKEAEHVEGFAKECAVVTHHRLEKGEEGLVPAGELEEPLVVRPTSEMIIGEHFAKWVESYRDLPLKVNQWANIVRWEMRTRIFLRTAEILWQEGHTAHATREDAQKEAETMHQIYTDFAKEALAIPMVMGRKTASERFPGADETYTIEAMMQDGKALQAGTSHFLGQNFAKACGITFRSQDGDEEHAWTTSWGTTTRLIGATIMVHGDDDGLVVPPRIAQHQVVIIPVIHKEETREKVMNFCRDVKKKLGSVMYHGAPLGVHVDERDLRGGEKVWGWVKKGAPIRIEVGPREVDEGKLSVTKRTRGHREFDGQSVESFVESVGEQLDEIHETMYDRACKFLKENTHEIDTKEEFYTFFEKGEKGFVSAHWCGDEEIEEMVQKDLAVTIRCIPNGKREKGKCPFTGKESEGRVIFAKSY